MRGKFYMTVPQGESHNGRLAAVTYASAKVESRRDAIGKELARDVCLTNARAVLQVTTNRLIRGGRVAVTYKSKVPGLQRSPQRHGAAASVRTSTRRRRSSRTRRFARSSAFDS